MSTLKRIAVVTSHPIQYYAPWFRFVAANPRLDLKVFYLWDFGVNYQTDRTFGTSIKWDIPLLDGYDYEFVPNVSSNPGTHSFGGLNNPSLLARVLKFAPDAVMVFGYGWRSMLEFILRRPKALPVLIRGDAHFLCPTPFRLRSWLKRYIAQIAISRCDAALAVGVANRQFYLANSFPEERIFHVPHCVDNARFSTQGRTEVGQEFRQRLGIPEAAKVVLFAGKFERKKRPDLLVRAFRHIADDNAILMLVGSGQLESQLKQMAADDARIRFLPFQNQSQIPQMYAAADLIVLPSEGPGETWGLVINEAMNCGCAAIVSTHVGCGPDLVHGGMNGWHFSAGSQDALERVLADALADPERLRRYGEASMQLIQNYSFESATGGLLQAIDAVTASQRM